MAVNIQGGDPTQYVLGRGKLYLKGETGRLTGGLTAGPLTNAWRDIGNVTAFTVTQERETKEHKSMLSGLQTVDLSLSISQKMNISFTTDEISLLNLSMFLSGDLATNVLGWTLQNTAGVASSVLGNMYFQVNTDDVFYDLWYDLELLVIDKLVRAYDFSPQGSQAITVRKDATTNTAADGTVLTEGTHYVIDRRMGMIKFLNVGSGGAERGDWIQISWAASPDATKSSGAPGNDVLLHRIALMTTSGRSVALKFVQENPNNSDNQGELLIWKIKLQPDGEFGGISDDWAGLSFSGSAESYDGTIPLGASKFGMFTRRTTYVT